MLSIFAMVWNIVSNIDIFQGARPILSLTFNEPLSVLGDYLLKIL